MARKTQAQAQAQEPEQDTNGKTQIGVYISTRMADALDAFVSKGDKSQSQVVREAIATYIHYNLTPDEIVVGRPTKYASPEEALAAQKAARKARQDLINRLLAQDKAAKKVAAIKALEDSLARKAQENTTPATPATPATNPNGTGE